MSSLARSLNLSYLRYSNMCSILVRSALREQFQKDAADRNLTNFKYELWENGSPSEKKVSVLTAQQLTATSDY